MNLIGFLKKVLRLLFSADFLVRTSFRFSQSEINEIVSNADKDNLKYLERLVNITELSAFDISFLMSNVALDDKKISIIQHACKMYDEREFKSLGQTFSDFIFRVSANINYLDESNLTVFKELVQCKNELYDFSNILNGSARFVNKKKNNKMAFAFENVFVN